MKAAGADSGAAPVGVQWTAEQYLRRVVVEVASATGRSVAVVAGESLALTLWTWAELQVMADEVRVARLGERVDLAGMVAAAFHEPKQLAKQERRYLREAGLLGPMLEAAKQRALATAAKLKAAERKKRKGG